MTVVGAVVPAAGRGERLGGALPKALVLLAGEPLLVHAVRGLRAAARIGPIVVAAPPDAVDEVHALLALYDVVVVAGGAERSDSVRAALAALPAHVDRVLVHDAARALTPVAVVDAVIDALDRHDAAIPVLPLADTVKRVQGDREQGDRVVETLDRSALRAVQTPQGFRRDVLAEAHAAGTVATDDAALVERLGRTVAVVPGAREAFKVTQRFDLLVAEAVLGAS